MTGAGGTDVTPEQEAVGLTTRRGERPSRHRGDPPGVTDAELLEDFRLALMSRFLDDREISLQKQSRVFFQISGAGHEALALGLARHLRASGVEVVEVDRPNRQVRRRSGKSDPLDAIEAARAALSGRAQGAGKAKDGNVEAIRALVVARRSARDTKAKPGTTDSVRW